MDLSGVGIRRAYATDFPFLIELAGDEIMGFDAQHWQQRLPAPGVFTYLAEDKAIFGFVTVGRSVLLRDSVGEVFGLYLERSHRRGGMGKKLLVRGLSVLKRRGFKQAVVFIAESEPEPARLLLEDIGFTPDAGTREINHQDQVFSQIGYGLPLDDYF